MKSTFWWVWCCCEDIHADFLHSSALRFLQALLYPTAFNVTEAYSVINALFFQKSYADAFEEDSEHLLFSMRSLRFLYTPACISSFSFIGEGIHPIDAAQTIQQFSNIWVIPFPDFLHKAAVGSLLAVFIEAWREISLGIKLMSNWACINLTL